MDRQILLWTIRHITELFTSNSRAKAHPKPFLCRALISLTCATVNFAFHCASPFAPQLCRPFFMQSRQLSPRVPSQRWSGLTQCFTSQRWRTQRPSGIGPNVINHIKRCAPPWILAIFTCPYPFGDLLAIQSQQVSVFCTFCMNLSKIIMGTGYNTIMV